MSKFANLSRKEQFQKRMELVTEARTSVALAEKNGGVLTGEDKTKWEQLDADIEALNTLLEHNKADEMKAKLGKWDEAVEKDPGRLSEPTVPLQVEGGLAPLTYRGQPLELEDRDMQSLRQLSSPKYATDFARFLKGGGSKESLAMKMGEDAKGGVLASMQFVSGFIKFVDDLVLMRQLGTVIPTNGAVGLGAVSWDTDPGDCDWTPEIPASDITADDAARLGNRELIPHGFSKLVKVSNKLRRHHPMLVNFLLARLGYKAAVTEEKGFMTGTGLQQPLGVFTASDNGITTSQDVETTTSVTVVFDDFINTLFDMKQQYWPNASWIMSRQCLKVVRKLKDTTNQYLWQPAPKDGTPSTILERPYNLSEFIPGQTAAAWTAGVYVAAVGDWKNYWIADSLQIAIRIIEELFSLSLQTGFLLTKETDGQPVLAEAFRRIKLKT